MTGATIIQFFAYLCYNRWLHPFKVLVENYQPGTETDPVTIKLIPVEPKESEDSERYQQQENFQDPEELESPEASGYAEENIYETCEAIVEQPDESVKLVQKQKSDFEIVQSC